MRYYKNKNTLLATIGQTSYQEITQEEYEQLKKEATSAEKIEQEYWASIPYEEAVVNEIRKKYDVNAELAILRQKEEKPEEYAEYYAYCEQCKTYVKEKKSIAP